jgi:dimethylhistidine N-methyltransferase
MEQRPLKAFELLDLAPELGDLRADALAGLRAHPKVLSPKYFYDKQGSALFEQITELPQYYPTGCELSIMQEHAPAMAERMGSHCLMVELGSGTSMKTRYLLDTLDRPVAYVPVDIDRSTLLASCSQLRCEYPELQLSPVCADFTKPFPLPETELRPERAVIYFPGSTIGNFTPQQAVPLLQIMASALGPGGGLLLGIDMKKDPRILHDAYNDAPGITSAFNLNLLARLNRELGCDFQFDCFRHYAFYNPTEGRIEMHLVSTREQTVMLDGESIHFAQGESICTEYSYKYEPKAFDELARRAGFTVRERWRDRRGHFSVLYLEANED